MSEEFSMSASFEMASNNHMTDLQTLLEHLDLYETEAARKLLANYRLAAAQEQIESLTSPHSSYNKSCDLVDMYIAAYDDSVSDFELSTDESRLIATLSVDGHDHDADDFCAALVLVLLAIGAKNIEASGGSPFWNAKWYSDAANNVHLEYSEEEY
jgi:hypothetical protein